MTWQLRKTREGRPYLCVTYSSRLDWDAAIEAALAGAGVRRNQLGVVMAIPAPSSRASLQAGSRKGLIYST